MTELKQSARCSCLRSKSSYGLFGEYHEDVEQTSGATTTFWCLATMGKAGPDEHYVHASICREGRSCWQSPDEA